MNIHFLPCGDQRLVLDHQYILKLLQAKYAFVNVSKNM